MSIDISNINFLIVYYDIGMVHYIHVFYRFWIF